jgi:uncharacterized protein (TIGR03086 family)
MTDDIDLLESVLDKTGGIVAGVKPEDFDAQTPCPDYDVRQLVNHITGWVRMFAASAHGEDFQGDPTAHEAGDDPGAEFRDAAGRVVAGWRKHGLDRKVTMMGGEQPAQMVLNMTLMEYLAHGWDLAVATDQPVPYSDEEAAAVLERARGTLPAQYRGPDKPFGDIVDVPDSASAVDRFVAFMGRRPRS